MPPGPLSLRPDPGEPPPAPPAAGSSGADSSGAGSSGAGSSGAGSSGAGSSADGAWRRPDPALLTLRRLECAGVVGVLTLAAAAVLLAARGPLPAGAALLAGAGVLIVALGMVRRRVEAWAYAEREDDLLIRRGVLVQRTSVVPYGRMQYVDVTAGPLDRRFGVATVVLHTAAAATDAVVPGLRSDEAARLRDRLAALGEARAAGL